jgi:hypothetical protein
VGTKSVGEFSRGLGITDERRCALRRVRRALMLVGAHDGLRTRQRKTRAAFSKREPHLACSGICWKQRPSSACPVSMVIRSFHVTQSRVIKARVRPTTCRANYVVAPNRRSLRVRPWRVHGRQEGFCSLARFLLGRKPRLRRPASRADGLAANSPTRLDGCALLGVHAPCGAAPRCAWNRCACGAICLTQGLRPRTPGPA